MSSTPRGLASKVRKHISVLCAVALTLQLVPASAYGTDSPTEASEVPEAYELTGEYEEGQVIVQLAEGASLDELSEIGEGLGVIAADDLNKQDMAFDYVLLELAEGVDVEEALEALDQQDCVADVQANHIYHLFEGVELFDEGADELQNEPAYPESTASDEPPFDSTSPEDSPLADAASAPLLSQLSVSDPEADRSSGRQRSQLEAVNAYDAWGLATTDGQVTIAVLDTGCDLTHPDLDDNVISEAAYNAIDDSSDVTDASTHGTHVAGIAAAEADNGIGVAGVSYNARILPVKVVADDGSVRSFDACRGMQYVADVIAAHPEYNLRVVNMSFGGRVTKASSDDQAVIRAIDSLTDLGVLTVCAAGNTDASKDEVPPYRSWPGDFSDNILSVINSDGTGRSGGSNFNQMGQCSKRISAPGTSIYSTVPGGDYGSKTGTSMASPCVAGLAALTFAANPSLAADEAANILCSTARDLAEPGFDAQTGFGLVDAAASVHTALDGTYLTGAHSTVVGASIALAPSSGSAAEYVWSSSNEGVAQVDPTGTIYGVSEGQATITASNEGATLSTIVSVYNPQFSGDTELKAGASATWKVSCDLPAVWVWSSSDTSVATASDTGTVRAVSPGTATITVALSSNPRVSRSAQVTVVPATVDLAKAEVELAKSYPYTGSVITPKPTVTLAGTTLVSGTDYRLSYANNLAIGTATVRIEGKGDYSGFLTRNFTITGSLKDARISTLKAQVYTGAALSPKPKVTFDGTTLKAGTDYSLFYKNNVKTGTATVTITGKGCYTGTRTATFAIGKAANSLSAKATTKMVKASKVKSASVKVKPISVGKHQGSVTYKKVSGSKRLSINGSTGKVTVKKGTRKGTYSLKVKVTAKGDANHRAASKTVTVKVKVK